MKNLLKTQILKKCITYTKEKGGFIMYNQSYEEYIRSILGYPNYSYNNDSMSYIQSQGYNQDNNFKNSYNNTVNNNDLEQYYPEIYKIVYPMVSQICSNNTREITREVIDEMTDEIYSAIEGTSDNEINLSINLQNNIRTGENRTQGLAHAPQRRVGLPPPLRRALPGARCPALKPRRLSPFPHPLLSR